MNVVLHFVLPCKSETRFSLCHPVSRVIDGDAGDRTQGDYSNLNIPNG
jgi:hypothetical protein